MVTIFPDAGEGEDIPMNVLSSKKREPLRRCVVCTVFRRKAELIRLAELEKRMLTWEGEAVRSPSGKGVYLCRTGQCISRFLHDKRMKKRYGSLLGEEARRSLERMTDDQSGQEKGESCCS